MGKKRTDWKWKALLLHFRRLYETTRVIFGKENKEKSWREEGIESTYPTVTYF